MAAMDLQRLRIALAVVAALAAAPALADEPPISAGPTSSPPQAAPISETPAAAVTPAPLSTPLTTAEQIDAFNRSSPAATAASEEGLTGMVLDDRKVHGEVSLGIGTGGYRSVYARTDLPVGETGRLSIAIAQSKNDYGYDRPHYGQAYGGRPFGGFAGESRSFGAALSFGGDRQRCDLETMTPERRLDVEGGPNGRCRAPLFPR